MVIKSVQILYRKNKNETSVKLRVHQFLIGDEAKWAVSVNNEILTEQYDSTEKEVEKPMALTLHSPLNLLQLTELSY